MPTRRSAAPPTTCSNVTAASSKPPTTAAKPLCMVRNVVHERRLRRDHRRHPPARHDRLRALLQAAGSSGSGAAGDDDRFRLRSGAFDRQSPAGGLASWCSTSRSAWTNCSTRWNKPWRSVNWFKRHLTKPVSLGARTTKAGATFQSLRPAGDAPTDSRRCVSCLSSRLSWRCWLC